MDLPKSSNVDKMTSFHPLAMDKNALASSLAQHLAYTVGKDHFTAEDKDWLASAIYAVRDRLIERWMDTMRHYYEVDAKRVYYLSLEYLMGRSLSNSLLNLGIYDEFDLALQSIGIDLQQLCETEDDAGLGNGGLGRLAACFLDSFATLHLPGYAYGIRYEYGIFRQSIENGQQVEHPDNWLRYGNPWEYPRPKILYPVKFGGQIIEYRDQNGRLRHQWLEATDVMAMAYDTPIPGFNTSTVNNMRLWSARASRDFDLEYFNRGDYIHAVAEKNASENLAKVLYPVDVTSEGKELRLKQQYFFVSASLQDILRRFNKLHKNWEELPDKVAIQLNDTHPAIAIPELMRVLIDEKDLPWDKAWETTRKTFSYTNHTLMPEALESWPVDMMEQMLPRHMRIIYDINHQFLEDVRHQHPGNNELLRELSLIDESNQQKRIRMAHLAIVGSHKVNGVAQLHTDLLKQKIFSGFNDYFPDKFVNITNGITPRRWLHQANRPLSKLISQTIGDSWQTNLNRLQELEAFKTDAQFQDAFRRVKHENKARLAQYIKETLELSINPNSLFDVQVKRLHEYKRQLLNLLHVITRYVRIKKQPNTPMVPRTVIFSGKAAPGYDVAKLIINLINDVADIINNDPDVGDKLKVVFLPNYSVSLAELIIPAADLSEQISTAGTEASGTGNMKLALNGALTIGTLDGANIEIKEEVGEENIFIFGLTAEEAAELKQNGYQSRDYYKHNHELKTCLDMIQQGFFNPHNADLYLPIVDNLLKYNDNYLLLADYAAYIACQERVDECYTQQDVWTEKAIINVANMSKFSSDRSIQEYAEKIWQVKQIKRD